MINVSRKPWSHTRSHLSIQLAVRHARLIDILNNYLTFGLSWCLFYGVRWRICATHFTHEMLGRFDLLGKRLWT